MAREETVNDSTGVSDADVDAAVAELRSFIAHLTRAGAVGPDGQVKDPVAVVTEVESNRDQFAVLGTAVPGGAKDAILAAEASGAGALVVALLCRD